MSNVCVINENDIVKISHMPSHDLERKMTGMSLHAVLSLMREMQIALAAYSKKHSTYDAVQEGMLGTIAQVERKARGMFVKDRLISVLKSQSWFLKSKDHMQTVKNVINEEWSQTRRRYSY